MADQTITMEVPAVGDRPADGIPPAGAHDTLPCTVIERRRGWQLINLREVWRYRELAYFLCWRDIKVRYKQTVLGLTWTVIQPLLSMVVFTLFLGRGAGLQEGMATPYQVFVLAGLVPWTLFSQSLSRSSQSIVASANLVTKVYFPRILIPTAATGACLLDFGVGAVILGVVTTCYGVMPSIRLLMLPIFVLLALIAALGVGTLISALNVAYRDFRYAVPFVVQTWMFLTPVLYPDTIVPERWRWLLALNPMTGAISGCRACVIPEFAFDWPIIGVSAGVALAFFVLGLAFFRRVERRFADII